MQVLFFHGLPLEDVQNLHIKTWVNGENLLWPDAWLVKDFPGVHVFYVKYDAVLKNENFHMNNVGENLVSDLLQAEIGQVLGCPVVLVGHSIGGLVIKALCLKAHEELSLAESSTTKKLQTFIDNIRGVFYYSTPHRGIRDILKASNIRRSPMFSFFEILSNKAAILDSRFEKLRRKYSWKIRGVGESLEVQSVNMLSVNTYSSFQSWQIPVDHLAVS
jgi:pimeloyl-ACP methyl ester carboxylesterase